MKSVLLLLKATAIVLLDQSAALLISVHSLTVLVTGLVLMVCSDCYQCIKTDSVLPDAKRLVYGMYSLYTTPLVIKNHPGISFYFYAGDVQLYVHPTHKRFRLGL